MSAKESRLSDSKKAHKKLRKKEDKAYDMACNMMKQHQEANPNEEHFWAIECWFHLMDTAIKYYKNKDNN